MLEIYAKLFDKNSFLMIFKNFFSVPQSMSVLLNEEGKINSIIKARLIAFRGRVI